MNARYLFSENGKDYSKGSIGMWLSFTVIIIITGLTLCKYIELTTYTTIASTWVSILMIFTGYKGVLKGVNTITKKDEDKTNE